MKRMTLREMLALTFGMTLHQNMEIPGEGLYPWVVRLDNGWLYGFMRKDTAELYMVNRAGWREP